MRTLYLADYLLTMGPGQPVILDVFGVDRAPGQEGRVFHPLDAGAENAHKYSFQAANQA